MARFERGSNIVCVDINGNFYNRKVNLTYGKVYDVIIDSWINHSLELEVVIIVDDLGVLCTHDISMFMSVCEHRAVVINNVLDL